MKLYREAVENALINLPLLQNAGEEPVTEAVERNPAEHLPPQPLRSAMRYSLLLPGKRLRPCLLLAAYHLLKDDWQSVIPFACALEMIHTYSLVTTICLRWTMTPCAAASRPITVFMARIWRFLLVTVC